MQIATTDRRVTINGATATHQGTVEILLKKIGLDLDLVVLGHYGTTGNCWCVLQFSGIPVEDLRGKVTLDIGLMLRCYGAMGTMSSDMLLDLMLEELLVSVTFDLFPTGTKKCALFIRGLDQEMVAEINEPNDKLKDLFNWSE
jgi:hypothetical protein